MRDDRAAKRPVGLPGGALSGLVIALVRNSILTGPARVIARLVARQLHGEFQRIVHWGREAGIVPREQPDVQRTIGSIWPVPRAARDRGRRPGVFARRSLQAPSLSPGPKLAIELRVQSL